MLKNPKERLLAIVLFAIVGLSSAHSLFESTILAPLDEKRQNARALQQRVSQQELEYRRIIHAQKHLEDAYSQSLPADPATATAFYQQWLYEQTAIANISDAQVTAGRPLKVDSVGHRIPFTVQADMTPRQLGELLDEIEKQPLLHNVRHITTTVGRGGNADRQMSVTVGIEAFCLLEATDREGLFDNQIKAIASESDANKTPMSEFLASESPFLPGYAGPPVQPVHPVTRPQVAPVRKKDYRFIAGVKSNGKAEAWLYDPVTKTEKVIFVGTEIMLDELQLKVLRITKDSLTIRFHQQEKILPLGGLIRSVVSSAG